ncbi:copper-transporting ATPase, partial [Klebsiella pneumoniae]|nr:copper-transporting ATPase [Klebsiella pneumoniae]
FERAIAVPGRSDDEILLLATSLDQGSEHPLAHAIVDAGRARKLPLEQAVDFESSTGIGVRGQVSGRRLALGNTALMGQDGV